MKTNYQNLLNKVLPSKEETLILINNAIKGSSKDKWILALSNIRYVYSIVQRHLDDEYNNIDEMIGDGLVGFYHAIEKLHTCNLNQFMAYSASWIEQSIVLNKTQRLSIFNVSKPSRTHNRVVTTDEIISNDNEKYKLTLKDKLIDLTQLNPLETMEEDDNREYAKGLVNQLYTGKFRNILTQKEKIILKSWLQNNSNNAIVAKEVGTSREMVRRIMDVVLGKCYQCFSDINFYNTFGQKGRVIKQKLIGQRGVPFRYTVAELDNNNQEYLREKKEQIKFSPRLFINNRS